MRSDDIAAQLKQRPFVPFRMCFPDGSHYEVRHSETLLVSQPALALTIHERSSAALPERIVLCDPMPITRMEQMDGDSQAARGRHTDH